MLSRFKKPKTADELTAGAEEALGAAVAGKPDEKTRERLSRSLLQIKQVLYGEEGALQGIQHTEVASLLFEKDLIAKLVRSLAVLDFEARKDTERIVTNVVRQRRENVVRGSEYFLNHPDLLGTLCEGYRNSEIALNCGAMLRDIIRNEEVCKYLLYSPGLFNYFDYVQSSNFDVVSDAFFTFKELLTRHRTLAAEFLESSYETFFERYCSLIRSENYVTRRQSLRLLSDVILDRSNIAVMNRFISDPKHMMLVMKLLRDQRKSIQIEAFHVFKIFVANPNKPAPIVDIITNNREKLVAFLGGFHSEKEEEDFQQDKERVIEVIKST